MEEKCEKTEQPRGGWLRSPRGVARRQKCASVRLHGLTLRAPVLQGRRQPLSPPPFACRRPPPPFPFPFTLTHVRPHAERSSRAHPGLRVFAHTGPRGVCLGRRGRQQMFTLFQLRTWFLAPHQALHFCSRSKALRGGQRWLLPFAGAGAWGWARECRWAPWAGVLVGHIRAHSVSREGVTPMGCQVTRQHPSPAGASAPPPKGHLFPVPVLEEV